MKQKLGLGGMSFLRDTFPAGSGLGRVELEGQVQRVT